MTWVKPSQCTGFWAWVSWECCEWQAGNVRQYGRWVTFHRLLGFEWKTMNIARLGQGLEQRLERRGDQLDRLTMLADELRLALARQRSVNEALVKALERVRGMLQSIHAHATQVDSINFDPGLAADVLEVIEQIDIAPIPKAPEAPPPVDAVEVRRQWHRHLGY